VQRSYKVLMVTSVTQSAYSDDRVAAWLRGLLTIAWADGDFAQEEKEAIASVTQDELAPKTELGQLEPISPTDLAAQLGDDPHIAENFLRTAVMVAIADGVYTSTEADLLNSFSSALGLEVAALKSLEHTLYDESQAQTLENAPAAAASPIAAGAASGLTPPPQPHGPDLLHPVRDWLDGVDVQDPRLARFICKLVPSQCPFERDVKLFGRKSSIFHPCVSSIPCTSNWWVSGSARFPILPMTAKKT